MFKYYGSTRVNVLRYFTVNGESYSEISLHGKKVVVKVSELTDEPSEVESKLEVKDDAVTSTVEDDKSETSVTISADEVTGELQSKDELVDVEGDEDDELEAVETVIARNKKGKEFNLGSREELEESEDVKKFKLDVEAINRVLDGKQKQHKGYTFEIK